MLLTCLGASAHSKLLSRDSLYYTYEVMKTKKAAIRTYSRDRELIESRRREIAEKATSLFVKKGYEKTSVREIADACEIGIGTLYRYVGAKDDILHLVIEQGGKYYADFMQDIESELDTRTPTEAIKHAVTQYYKYIERVRDITVFAYQVTDLPSQTRRTVTNMERRFLSILEKVLAKGVETGEFDIDNIKMVAHSITVIGHMWAVRRWFRRTTSLDEYIDQQSRFILRGIGVVHETAK